ncbi:MAG: amino acid permease [Holophagaceae bacterium]|uniref:Amino acid permease n=1 Tax=Candidatus Geothrix skivensis TaxID=2954439 RepID=A0A9D7XIE3_9BACT|nr:amino acid permease [Candidatus Geothrix skivensis]
MIRQLFRQLLRTKPIEQIRANAEEVGHHGLRRTLTAWDLALLGVGAIIGAGILSALGTGLAGGFDSTFGVTRPAAGPALIISFLMTALACGFTALCYAEFASMIPASGSAYTYTYATLGELMAWIIGWDLLLEYAVSNVAVAISWGSYMDNLLRGVGLTLPRWLSMDPRTMLFPTEAFAAAHQGALNLSDKLHYLAQAKAGGLDGAAVFANWSVLKTAPIVGGFPFGMNLLAMIITFLITALCIWGVKESVRANNIMVTVKVALLLMVIAIGAFYVKPENFHPFAPNGWRGIQAGAAIIFFAFIGFDAVSTTAEECKDPARDMPRGIIGSLLICTVIYVGVCAVVAGILPYSAYLGVADPIAHAFTAIGMNRISAIVSVGAVVALGSALLVYQMAQPRIFMVMSRDGLLPPWFGRVSPRFRTPLNATLLTGVIVLLPAGFMNIDEIIELTNIGTLFAFVLVCAGILVLRVRRPLAERRFRAPLVWLTAPLGILFCLWLALGLPRHTWVRFWIWLGLGLLAYFLYSARHSRLRQPAAS